VERRDHSDHPGKLAPLKRIPSGLPLLTPGLWRLANAVAVRQAGTVADVLRLAIPSAHVTTEKALLEAAALNPGAPPGPPPSAPLVEPVPPGAPITQPPTAKTLLDAEFASTLNPFVANLTAWQLGRAAETAPQPGPRVVWNYLPGPDLANGLVAAARQAINRGGQMLVVAPSEKDVAYLVSVLTPQFRTGRLVAGDGPAARLEAYWAAAAGAVDVLVGTRAAAYVPLASPVLLVLVDDGDPALLEPHAPYGNARSVLTVRAGQEGAALVLAGYARTVEAQGLVESGWMGSVAAERTVVRAAVPRVAAPTAEDLAREGATAHTRFPEAAFRVVRRGLADGPVLVQVPSAEHEVYGLARTAFELARAFPEVPVKRSAAQPGVMGGHDGSPELVLATPGAEPATKGGYAAGVLLDGGAWAARPQLDATVDALRIWMGAAVLVRPRAPVILVGAGGGAAAQALVRWDPAGLAARELEERRELGLPPWSKAVVCRGERPDVADLLARARLPETTRTIPGPAQTVLLFPLPVAQQGVAEVRAAIRARSMARTGGPVRVEVDGALD
jgi:primosomal protein N' (replication factor Y)